MRCSMTTAALCLAIFELSNAAESASAIKSRIDIPPQALAAALQTFAKGSNVQLVYVAEEIDGVRTRGVTGELTQEEALRQLLSGTGLTFKYLDEKTVTIMPAGTGASSADQAVPEIEQVIVTAQRREQNLQDVPISITALGEAKLRALGAYEFADFARTVPGLTFNEFGHNDGSFTIRGVSSSMDGGGIQATVGTYIDDLPSMDTYAGLSNPDLYLFDVNRVEVLRGPQGTLFGSGAMGGAVRVITNKPDAQRFAAAADMLVSTTQDGEESYGVSAMANIPLSDALALRVVGYKRDNGGWVDSVEFGKDRDDVQTVGGRVMLKYQATDKLALTGTITYQNSEPADGTAFTNIVDGKPVRDRLVPELVDDRFTVYNLVAEYEFDTMRLRSATTYAKKEVYEQQDATASTRAIFGAATPASNLNWQESSNNFFQELHLFSTTNKPLSWFVGAFYRKQNNRNYDFSWIVPGSEDQFGSGPAGAAGDDVYSFVDVSDTSERAVFGELSYKLTSQLEATVGARYFENSYDNRNTTQGALNGGFSTLDLRSREEKATYKFVLSYTINDTAMIYAQAAEGYRVGNANPPVPDPTPPTFGPDSLWNYELGAKTAWLDRRLTLNGAVYFIDWRQMQLSQYSPGGWFYVTNVGSTRSMGAELEIEAQLSDRLSYSGGLAWNDAKIKADNPAINAMAGDRVPGVAHFTLSNQLRYDLPLSDTMNAYVRLNHQYIGGSYGTFNRATAVPMGDYHVVGLRIGAILDRWDISLFANNLLNDDAVVAALDSSLMYILRPRTIGVNARFTF